MKDNAGHENARITKLAGGTTRFKKEFINSIFFFFFFFFFVT